MGTKNEQFWFSPPYCAQTHENAQNPLLGRFGGTFPISGNRGEYCEENERNMKFPFKLCIIFVMRENDGTDRKSVQESKHKTYAAAEKAFASFVKLLSKSKSSKIIKKEISFQ